MRRCVPTMYTHHNNNYVCALIVEILRVWRYVVYTSVKAIQFLLSLPFTLRLSVLYLCVVVFYSIRLTAAIYKAADPSQKQFNDPIRIRCMQRGIEHCQDRVRKQTWK